MAPSRRGSSMLSAAESHRNAAAIRGPRMRGGTDPITPMLQPKLSSPDNSHHAILIEVKINNCLYKAVEAEKLCEKNFDIMMHPDPKINNNDFDVEQSETMPSN